MINRNAQRGTRMNEILEKKTKCLFGIYSEDGKQTKTFIKPFEEGLKKLEKMKKEKNGKM